MSLKWYDGCEVTEQEKKAIWEAIWPHSSEDMSDNDVQYDIDHDIITLNTCRNGRNVIWAEVGDNELKAVYVDTLETLSDEEVEKELL